MQAVGPRNVHGGDHVRGAGAAQDQARMPVDHGVPGRRCGRVQRCVHASMSAQYQWTSAHAGPPSGTMDVAGRWIPHSQHACVPVKRRAAGPPAWCGSAPSAVTGVRPVPSRVSQS